MHFATKFLSCWITVNSPSLAQNQEKNISAYCIPIKSQLLFTTYILHQSVNINAEK